MLLWVFHFCYGSTWQSQRVVIVTERWLFLFPEIHHCFSRFLCVMKSLPSYMFGESSHFPWCIPPTLSFSQCNSRSCTHTVKIQTTWAPHIHLSILLHKNGLGHLSQPPHCFIVVAALLLVSLQWSAGYSLNLWLLHNLWPHRSQRQWLSLSVVITQLQGRIEH